MGEAGMMSKRRGKADGPSPLRLAGRPSISVIICTLNEEQCLPHVLPRISACVSEVLLVDGHSTDRTVEVARELRPDIRVLMQPGRGKGDALRHGFRHATGDIIVTIDADGATDPADMHRFVAPLLRGHRFVKGSRFRWGLPKGMPRHRILGNWLLLTGLGSYLGRSSPIFARGTLLFGRRTYRVSALSPAKVPR